jgi:sugar lactone lactonase YvrE
VLEVNAWPLEPGLLSEGPRWHEERQELLWVDVLGSRFHRATLTADGSPDEVHTTVLDRHVGAVAPVATGGYVVAAGQGFLFVDEGGSVSELAQPEGGRVEVRMNDGACDPQGRFWAGTMAYDESPGAGTLYRLELDGSCSTVLTGLTISNGIGWSPDGQTMYLSDSGAAVVDAFDFDGATGALSRRRTLVRVDRPGVGPDGLTVDEQGDIWVGLYGGWAVNRYRPDGSLRATVHMPVAQATSCVFGGRDRSTLFVTTGRERLEQDALEVQPDAGRVFAVTGLAVRGPACAPYRGDASLTSQRTSTGVPGPT